MMMRLLQFPKHIASALFSDPKMFPKCSKPADDIRDYNTKCDLGESRITRTTTANRSKMHKLSRAETEQSIDEGPNIILGLGDLWWLGIKAAMTIVRSNVPQSVNRANRSHNPCTLIFILFQQSRVCVCHVYICDVCVCHVCLCLLVFFVGCQFGSGGRICDWVSVCGVGGMCEYV